MSTNACALNTVSNLASFLSMAEASDEPCVPREIFYKHLDTLKSKQVKKESQITLFIEDAFFDTAKAYLKYQAEKQLGIQSEEVKLSKWETLTITRKKWAYSDDSIITPNKRKVVPKRELYEVLSLAHTRTAHRGRQITSKWINDNYSEVNVKVIAIFVGLCPIHAEQSPTFLSLVEIDLMDFRNCACDCTNNHTWAMNITDHHTKYVHVSPLTDKSADEVLRAFNNYCYTYGFPKKILTDNGKEFKNKKMEAFCQENGIQIAHGSPRTPTTQGLVERSNRSWKEDTRALIMSTSSRNVKKWCQKVREAAYTRNISYHRAIKMTPYEAVYGIKAHREVFNSSVSDNDQDLAHNETHPEAHEDLNECEVQQEQPKKRQKLTANQESYNNQMIKQTQKKNEARKNKFKVGDMVSIKIDRVDKTSPFHSNLLLGKIEEIVNTYARVVTKFGRIKTLISPTRLYPCSVTTRNIELDYSTELSFSAACKKAM